MVIWVCGMVLFGFDCLLHFFDSFLLSGSGHLLFSSVILGLFSFIALSISNVCCLRFSLGWVFSLALAFF